MPYFYSASEMNFFQFSVVLQHCIFEYQVSGTNAWRGQECTKNSPHQIKTMKIQSIKIMKSHINSHFTDKNYLATSSLKKVTMPYKWTFWDEVLWVFLDASPSLSSSPEYLTSKTFDPRRCIQESLDEGESRSSHLHASHCDFGCPSDFSKQGLQSLSK